MSIKKLANLEAEASHFGFKWENAQQILVQIQSECIEVNEHLDTSDIEAKVKLQDEIGDLLHAVFSLCLFCEFDPEKTLEKSVAKFERRFHAVKELAKTQGVSTLQGRSFVELMEFWDQAKQLVG